MLILNKGEYTGEIVQRREIDGSTITNTLYSEKESTSDWHYHENLHISFVFQGGKAETKNKSLYTAKDGSIFFYHAEEMHRWISNRPSSKSANIEISNSFLKQYDLNAFDIQNAIASNISAKTLILKMQNELLFEDQNSLSSLQTLLLDLVGTQAEGIQSHPKWVSTLRQLLHDQWNEVQSLTEISLIVGAHPVTISKNFRKYFGCTLGEYQRKLKIEKSIALIKDPDLSLSEVAFQCGFADQSHFIRNFKTLTGFLPKEYRKF
jgi:AraC family transcriptional regulator